MNRILHLMLALSVFSAVYLPAPAAQSGVLEFFFPSLRKDETAPTKGGLAPFATGAGEQTAPATAPAENNADIVIPLDQPHRRHEDIAAWVTKAVSEAMTFGSNDYNIDLGKTAGYFDDGGRRLYMDFLAKDRLNEILKSRKYYVRSFVEETPFLLNEGAVEGRYRWLYEVPVMVSFMDRTMKDYKKAKPLSQTMLLTVQIGRRMPQGPEDSGIVIERWSGRITGQPGKK